MVSNIQWLMNRALKLNRRVMAGKSIHRCISAALLAAAILLGACDRNSGDVARVGVVGPDPKLIETVVAPLSEGDALIRANMAQGLVRFDERGQVVPGLAERWNVSDDGLGYVTSARAARATGQSDDSRCTEFMLDQNNRRRAVDAAGNDRSADCWR